MSEKMKNLWVRTVSGAVLAVVMLGAIAVSYTHLTLPTT